MSSPLQRHGDSPPPDGTGDADAPRTFDTQQPNSNEAAPAPENQEPAPAGPSGDVTANAEGATAGTENAPDPPTPAAPSPTAGTNAGGNNNNRRRPLGSVTYFVPMPGGGPDGQQAQDGHQIVATLTMEIFANDDEGGPAGIPEHPAAEHAQHAGDGDQAHNHPHGDQTPHGPARQPAGTEPTPGAGAEAGREGEQNAQAQGAEGAHNGPREGNERGGGGGPILVFLDADGAPIQQGGEGNGGANGHTHANADGTHTHTHTFTIPWPNFAFPFPRGPRPPDPAKAAELLNSLPTVGRALLKRVDKIVAAEDAKRGDSDSSGWQCGICLEGVPLGETVKALPCNHLFHEPCLQPWFTNHHNNCPTCRLNLDPLRTLHEPRDARRNPLRPGATGSGRATPAGRGNHPYARDGAARGSRPGSNPGTRPPSPPPNERGPDGLPANPLEAPNPLDAAIDIARMFPFTASPLPMRRDEQRDGDGEGGRDRENRTPTPAQPSGNDHEAAGPSNAPNGTASPGVQRPTPERRPHITIIRVPSPGDRAPEQPEQQGEQQAAPQPAPQAEADAAQAEGRDTPQAQQPVRPAPVPSMANPFPEGSFEHRLHNFAHGIYHNHPGAAGPDQGASDTAAGNANEADAGNAGANAEAGAADLPQRTTVEDAADEAAPGPSATGNNSNPASARGTPNPEAAAPGENAEGGRGGQRGAGGPGRHFRLPFELLFLSAGFGPGAPGGAGMPGMGPAEGPAPEPQPEFVPQSLESWTAQREKTLGWRCDAVECLVAPPVPDSDKMDIDEDDGDGGAEEEEEESVTVADKEMLAIYAPAQGPFPKRLAADTASGVPPHIGHDFVLLACEHHWHRTCLETAVRSAGHSAGPDPDGREWIRCARCRKEGWVVPRDSFLPEPISEALPMEA